MARVNDEETTVKRFRRLDNRVQLLPENPDFEPLEFDLRHDSPACLMAKRQEGITCGE